MNSKLSHSVNLYKNLSKIPSPLSAVILPGINDDLLSIHSTWSTQDFVKLESTVFSRDYLIQKKGSNVLSTGIASDVSSISLRVFSKSGKKQAVLLEKQAPEEKRFIEIWSDSLKKITFDMTNCEEHGKIYEPLGGFKWSSDEKYLLYAAEGKQPKTVSFFKASEKNEEISAPVPGDDNLYREDWGEPLYGVHHSVLCILEVETGKVEVLPTDTLVDISVGQAQWGPNDECVVFVGWKEFPQRMALGCMSRRASLYALNLKTKEIDCITAADNVCVRSARFSPDFSALIYLENEAHGVHMKGARLQKCDWKTKKISTLVDLVDHPTGDEFPGIYLYDLPQRCWSEDGKQIYFSTAWRSYVAVVSVNIDDGSVRRIETVGEDFGATEVLDVQNNFIVAHASSPDTEPCLILGHIGEKNKAIDWKFLDQNTPVRHPDVKWKVITLTPSLENKKYPNLDYEIIVMSPSEVTKKNPLIVIPHGGPHQTEPLNFQGARRTGLVKSGYIICIVNFRGSLGFGENSVHSLPGNIGTQDVVDCQDAALYVKSKCGFDVGDVFVFGVSHGGFLAAHLCGQYPGFYKGAAIWNPAIDISSMIGITDVPDWCWVEAGIGNKLEPSAVVQPDHLKSMWEKSPIRYADKVSTPTVLLLGKKDIRVPMCQGIQYHNLLKARNVPTKVYQFDDNHILARIPYHGDVFLQALLWFRKYSSS